MPNLAVGLDAVDKFVKLGNELTKLPALFLPQYRAAATGLYQICQKLLIANENLARWLYNFQYFDFTKPDAKSQFLDLSKKYSTMKAGAERRDLKFRCGDISLIYQKEIASKMGGWFTNQQRITDAAEVFHGLSEADNAMVEFIDEEILSQLDKFEAEADALLQSNDVNGAEAARLRFKAGTREMGRRLEEFSGELSDLVLQFARIAGVPVTLTNTAP
jgi:hypothetical protein